MKALKTLMKHSPNIFVNSPADSQMNCEEQDKSERLIG